MTFSKSDMTSRSEKTALLEKLISTCPIPRSVNPFYHPTAVEAEEFLAKFGLGSGGEHKRAFWARNIGLLTVMSHPLADIECPLADWIRCLFAFETVMDKDDLLMLDEDGGPWAYEIAMEALDDLLYYRAKFWTGEGMRYFLEHAQLADCTEGTRRRFFEATQRYLSAVPEQVEKRRNGIIPSLDEYLALRRETSGLKMCFAVGEFGLMMRVPDAVFDDEMMKTMQECAIDIAVLYKDMSDGRFEQGDTCNIIAVAMQEKDLTFEAAWDFATELSLERMALFFDCRGKLHSYGPDVDQQVRSYIDLLEDWNRSETECWDHESQQFRGGQIPPSVQTKVIPFLMRTMNPKSDSAA
ncbi:hypothetical protein FS837_010231 [Tulasnella sp. UAMH 9824]|nr:hypothetical protein FS837_010231 [Tulasnella sp. UAMH 9824]